MPFASPEAYAEKPFPCPHKEGITCHKAICENCDYKPTIRVVISSSESYPVFDVTTNLNGYEGIFVVDMGIEWLERYKKCMVEYGLIQEYLSEIYPFK